MNKIELIEKIANKVGLDRKYVIKILEGFEDVVIESLLTGQEVTLTGFGTFIAKYRSSRMGVNPQKPSERISVPAVTVPKFRAGKTLKDALKQANTNKGENAIEN